MDVLRELVVNSFGLVGIKGFYNIGCNYIS